MKRFFSNQILRIVIAVSVLVFLSAILVFIFEKGVNEGFATFFDSIYWAVVTTTTVGYGNQVPITFWGKLLSIFTMFMGVVTLGIVTGRIASYLVERSLRERKGMIDLKNKSKHLVICGWNTRMEKIVFDVLSANKGMIIEDVVVVANIRTEEADKLKLITGLEKINIIRGEHYNEAVLKRSNVNKARKAIIIADTSSGKTPDEIDSQTMMTAMAIDSLGGTYVCAELLNPKYEKYLRLANCDEIIFSSEYSRILIANASASTGIVNVYHKLLDPASGNNIFTAKIPKDYFNKPYIDLYKHFKGKGKAIIIGLLENTGSRNELKEQAIIEAQKTPDISKLVNNLMSVKQLAYNSPVLNPSDDYIVGEKAMAILVGAE